MNAAEASVETIQREMTAFARRARASAGRMHPELSLVSYTLLGHLEESGGCRATDLAAHYALDKASGEPTGVGAGAGRAIERRVDPEDHPVQVLQLTEAGTRILAQVTQSRLDSVSGSRTGRLRTWSGSPPTWCGTTRRRPGHRRCTGLRELRLHHRRPSGAVNGPPRPGRPSDAPEPVPP